jgi:serine/threonine protein kinase
LLAYLTDQIDPRQNGLPRIHFYGKYDKYHALVMDLLGPSLEDMFQRCNKKFTLKTVVMIGLQIIDRLKYLHKKKFIHRDIKPENFLLGMNQFCGAVFMIDLGLSKKYLQKSG